MVVKKNNRRENFWARTKKETVLRLMTSLTVTVVAAATIVVVQAQVQPLVRFNSVSAIGTNIVYDAEILDIDNTLDDSSLFLYIKSSLEAFKIPLDLGRNFGTQEMRYLSSEYTLSIMGSQGFGQKTFASEKIISNLELSGAITGYALASELNQYGLTYSVDFLIYNKDETFVSMWLRYGYIESYLYQNTNQEPQYYQTLDITNLENTVLLQEIPNYNYTIFLYLEASDIDQKIYTLDFKTIKTPPFIDGSLFIEDVGVNYVEFSYYISVNSLNAQSAMVELYDGDKKIAEQNLDMTLHPEFYEPMAYQEPGKVRFANLTEEKTYTLKLSTSYIDEINGHKIYKQLYSSDFLTAPFYQLSAQMEYLENIIILTLTVDDPKAILTELQYNIYEIVDGYQSTITSGYFQMGNPNGTVTTYMASFNKPDTASYFIEVLGNKLIGETIYYATTLYEFDA